jgi:putative aldouronate transport system permease protein
MTTFALRARRRSRLAGTFTPSAPVRLAKGIVLALCCAVVLLPLLAVISTSLAGSAQVNASGGLVLWPSHPTFDSYRAILSGDVVTRALTVSIGVTAVGTTLSLICTIALAYGLSRPRSFGAKPVLLAVLFSILFTPGIIPSYLMVKQLGLIDSYWSLILPVLINGFNVIIMRSFFLDLPQELLDAARIDGAGDLRILTMIVLPLSKAVIAVIGLFYGVSYWNNFFSALLYINDSSKWPLQLVLRTYVVNGSALSDTGLGSTEVVPPQQSLQMAILVISLLPVLLAFPFVQRHLAKGVLLGGVKG